MKIPSTINIMSVAWRVDVVARDSCEGATMLASCTVGRCDPVNRRIIIVDGESPEDMLTTLLHEITHAARATMGMDDDEQWVTAWAAVWADTLIRNGIVKP